MACILKTSDDFIVSIVNKGCFFKFGVEVGVGESIEIAPLV
jgi:hypothetical protein